MAKTKPTGEGNPKSRPTTEGEAILNPVPQGDVRVEIPTSDGTVSTGIRTVNYRDAVVSDGAQSYVAASDQYPFYQADRALPQYIDDAEEQFGSDIYDRMKREPILSGIERVLKILVLADGLTITPSHQQPQATSPENGAPVDPAKAEEQADWEKADMVARYIRHVITRLEHQDRPIIRTLWNLLDAARLGHKLAEMTFDFIEDGEFAGKIGLKSFKTKPRKNYVFVVDEMNEFRGVIAKVPGGSQALRTGIVFDASKIPNAIAPEKLLILTLDDRDGDPRGVSWWREIYDPWYRKQLFKTEHIKTGVQFGGGMISVVLPEEKQSVPVDDPSGGKIPGVKGGKTSLIAATLWAAQQLRNGGIGVFRNGTVVNVHTPDANGSFFNDGFSMFDREMVTSFLQTSRSILEARHGSKADSDSAQDLLDELKMFIREIVCALLTNRMFRFLVQSSFGPEYLPYVPTATMARMSRPDFGVNATAVATLSTAVDALDITPNQKEYLKTQILGLPPSEAVAEVEDGTDIVPEDNSKPGQGSVPSEKPKNPAPDAKLSATAMTRIATRVAKGDTKGIPVSVIHRANRIATFAATNGVTFAKAFDMFEQIEGGGDLSVARFQ